MPRKNRFNKRHNSRKVEHYHFYPQYAAQNYQPRAMGNGWYCVFSPKGEDFYYHTSWLVNRSNYYARTSYGYQDTGLYNIPPLKRSENGPGNTNYNKPFFNFTYQNPNTNLNNNKPNPTNPSVFSTTNTPIFNFSKQPQVTPDFYFSSNHVYAFTAFTFLGLISHVNKKHILIYFTFISIFLELSHLIIPNRSFQFGDLFGNILGVLISILIIKIYNYLEKK